MKRLTGLFSLLLACLLLAPSSTAWMQEPSVPLRLELSGVNALEMPRVEVTANVYDALGQPVPGLTAEQFTLSGPLAEVARIVDVQNVASAELPYATVLVIDASDSMAGAPIEQAVDAARIFVENVREIDPVAVVAFGSTVRVLQDFTTDKDALIAAIESISLLGRTALFQAAYDGVDLALNGPVPRRAMVLLSDGAEYGGASNVTLSEALEHATLNGVASYTIGLGFGVDRAFLQQLATDTSAEFYESPTPDVLTAIYAALADRLSSQYILTLQVDAPLDGTEYAFELTAEHNGLSATEAGSVRAPIPVPVIDLSGVPGEPIDQLTEVTVEVRADQDLETVTMALDGELAGEFTAPPFSVSVNPIAFPPGPLALDVTATDADGDRGTGTVSLEIAALPPTISMSRDVAEMGAIPEPLELTVFAGGQTPITEVRLAINRGEPVTLEPPYTFILDPLQLPPGDNHFDVTAVNEAGLEFVYPADFIIADVPPVVTITGLTEGQTIDVPLSFRVDAQSQAGLSDLTATIYGVPLPGQDGEFTIPPMAIPPGATEVIVTATTEAGLTAETAVPITIAALPPTLTVMGLQDGATVTGNLELTISVQGQTDAVEGSVVLDGEEAAHPVRFPATLTLPLSAMEPGENTLSVTVELASGQTGTLNFVFTVPPSLFTPTPTPTETPNVPATGTASAFAASTRTAVAQQAVNAASTQAVATEAQATAAQAEALQVTETQAALAQATQERAAQVGATQTAIAQAPTQAPPSATPVPASATATATTLVQPAANLRATADAAATFVLQAATRAFGTIEAHASATAEAATAEVAETQAAATQQAATAQAQTSATAQAATTTAEADARAGSRTATAQARATTQANANLTATALASDLLTATAQVGRTATQEAAETASARAGATSTAGAVQAATQDSGTQAASTANAQAADSTSTAESVSVLATDNARMTRTARATLAAQTATAAVEATTAAQVITPAVPTLQPTLTPVDAQSSAGTSTTSALWVIFALIVLLTIMLVLWITRSRKRRMNGE